MVFASYCVNFPLNEGEYVSREEFESLKEEFVGVKTELEKRDKEIQSLKRGKACKH